MTYPPSAYARHTQTTFMPLPDPSFPCFCIFYCSIYLSIITPKMDISSFFPYPGLPSSDVHT